MRKCLLLFGLLLAFNVNADVVKEAKAFLKEVNNHQGFWFYNRGDPLSQETEQAFLKTYQGQSDFLFCNAMEDKRVVFKTVIKILKFAKAHTLLIFVEQKDSKRERMIRRFARNYQLPLMVINTQQNKIPAVFSKLNASVQDVYLVNPNERQIRLVSRAHHDCWLEEEFFLDVYQYLKQKKDLT